MQFLDSVKKGATGVTSLKADPLKDVQTTVIINKDNKSSTGEHNNIEAGSVDASHLSPDSSPDASPMSPDSGNGSGPENETEL